MYRGSFPTALYHPDGRVDLFKTKEQLASREDADAWCDAPMPANVYVEDEPHVETPVTSEETPETVETVDEPVVVKRGPGRPRKVKE